MSDLDRELRAGVIQTIWDAKERDISPNDAWSQIKHAFADAGWYHSPLVDFQMKRIRNGELMTGQEWYDRFWAIYNEDRRPAIADATIIRKQVDSLARRAAGLAE